MWSNCDGNVGAMVNGAEDNDSAFELPLGNYTMEGLQQAYKELCLNSPMPSQPRPQFSASPMLAPPSVPLLYHPYQGYGRMMNMPHLPENMQFCNHNQDYNNNNVAAIMSGAGGAHRNFRVGNPQQASRLRKKKSPIHKKYKEITYEDLNADSWAWRKYGQKPIKGSLFPRNYYRCSTSKGCAARRQVEKSSNSNKYMVWYIGEHTHPRPMHCRSLAGTTRNKNSTGMPAAVPTIEPSNVNRADDVAVTNVVDYGEPGDKEMVEGSSCSTNNDGDKYMLLF